MHQAIAIAKAGVAAGELPYGAVVVLEDGALLSAAHDQVEADDDLTSHAEFLAIREAGRRHGRALVGCTLVSTVEPCAMCFSAAWTAQVTGIVFGLRMRELRQERPLSMEEVTIDSDALNRLSSRRLRITAGVLAERCWELWP
ncbi:MAG: nucleoside deaminase [Actinomycetes bacterium]